MPRPRRILPAAALVTTSLPAVVAIAIPALITWGGSLLVDKIIDSANEKTGIFDWIDNKLSSIWN